VIGDAELRRALMQSGLRRVEKFTWSAHVRVLMQQFASTPEMVAEPVESTA
jgi:hypothetical protein